jgi:hypothetical protein
VPDEKIEALLAENAERHLTVLLVRSVHQATKLQSPYLSTASPFLP